MITSMGLEKLDFTLKDFVLQNDGDGIYIKEWFSDKPRPTTADIEAAHLEWQAEYDAQEYELTVALWEGVVEERMAAVTSLEGKRQAVKAKYPKGG